MSRNREIEQFRPDKTVVWSSFSRFEVAASEDVLAVYLSRCIEPRGARDLVEVASETLKVLKRWQVK